MSYQATDKFVFPKWANYFLPLIVLSVLGGGMVVPPLVLYGFSAETQNVGFQPEQPVPYSHAIHVGQLGLDCRYCHNTVDDSSFASIPPTQTCINCHAPGQYLEGDDRGLPTNLSGIHQASQNLRPVWESSETGVAVPWIKVHDLADYGYFDHSAHVSKGVGCVTCHGRVDLMGASGSTDMIAGVYQVNNLSMGWCIECHRAPEQHLRPLAEVTNMQWSPLDDTRVQAEIAAGNTDLEDETVAQLWLGNLLKRKYEINDAAYMQSCTTCHR